MKEAFVIPFFLGLAMTYIPITLIKSLKNTAIETSIPTATSVTHYAQLVIIETIGYVYGSILATYAPLCLINRLWT